jgi:hypothetical protein
MGIDSDEDNSEANNRHSNLNSSMKKQNLQNSMTIEAKSPLAATDVAHDGVGQNQEI